jgi:predicted membrane protein
VGALCLVVIIQCIAKLAFSTLPYPLAALYFVFSGHFGLPEIGFWVLLLAAILTSIGLTILLPNKLKKKGVRYTVDFDDIVFDRDDDAERVIMSGDMENNFDINVRFGGANRYIHSDSLETVHLSCKFGGIEVYLDEAKLSPNGATVFVDCKFGGIEIFVPREWQVRENVKCVAGSVDFVGRQPQPAADAPELTLVGNLAFGGVEVKFV